jgi:hypothetical protein
LHRHTLAAVPFLLVALFIFSAECKAQDNPTLKIDDDITRFAYSAGGRIAYSTRHVFSIKKIELQRDDIWICEPDGKKHRILDGQKFVRGTGPFSYTVHAIRWSPDGGKLAIELATSEMISNGGATREGVSTLLLDDSGREITIAGGDSFIPGASNAVWTADGATVVYLTARPTPPTPPHYEELPKNDKDIIHIMNRVQPAAGPASPVFAGHSFSAVAWNAAKDGGAAIESILPTALGSLVPPPNLVGLDLARQTLRVFSTLQGYAGGLTLSPSSKNVAYWIDNGQLEIRDVEAPNRAVRLRVPIGILAWSGDETRVMVKRGAEAQTGGLVWFTVPPLATVAAGAAPRTEEAPPQSVLYDLGFRLFNISPDGKLLAVIEPGRHNLLVYPIS